MGKAMAATSGSVEMTSISTEDRGNSQFSDAQKRVLRRASIPHAASNDLSDEEGAEGPGIGEETHTHLIHRLHEAKRMVPVSVRLGQDVLGWLHSKGEGHLARINDILTNLMEVERRAGAGD